ncbi:hypothetical protein [Mesorhizobium ventifaucium]|nr:hypothetical protein [Mesorhizobium ventifaucium]
MRVLSVTRLSLETDTFQPVSLIDLAEEKIIVAEGAVEMPAAAPKASRKSGNYQLVVFGEKFDAYSLKELLGTGLRALEKHKPGTLEKLSKIKTTTKRIVAHDPAALFDSEGLSEKFSMQLMNGWWYGTNNSAQETDAWLKRACDCAGVKWGKDFSTNL